MTLPPLNGWVIDFRTAREIFSSGNNQRISHCVDACANGTLHHCHLENNLFKSVPALSAPFVDDYSCQSMPDEEILKRSLAISHSSVVKKLIKGGNAAIFITATAAVNQWGVISNHRNLVFHTVYDLCKHYGVTILTADEYFEHFG